MECRATPHNVKRKKRNSKKKKVRQIKKKIKEIKTEPTGLEKSITEEAIKNIKFQEFSQPITPSAPVLTKVETPTSQSLEFGMASAPVPQTQEKESTGQYTTKNEPEYTSAFTPEKEDEKKYESEFQAPVLRRINSRQVRQESLESPQEIRNEINDTQRGIETNIIEHKRKEPFETQEERYREVKF